MKTISLESLPLYSPWPARLLGLDPFDQKNRVKSEVEREYNIDKWGAVLRYLQSNSEVSLHGVFAAQGVDPSGDCAYMIGEDFYLDKAAEVMKKYDELLAAEIEPYIASSIVELGSGIGDKLINLTKIYQLTQSVGGEFTESGVRAGELLAQKFEVESKFFRFDYNDRKTMEFIPAESLVYTSHSIEQVPILKPDFIEGLIEKSVDCVVHFEPCLEDQDSNSLIGQLRKKYIELNDYNRNLVSLVKEFESHGKLEIIKHEKNVFSDTPFNPTSILVWRPR